MSLLETIILGIIQGIAEFLPISSSGHLAIFKALFGLKDVGLTYDILLHLGTLVAVFIVYWKDIWKLIKEGVGIVIDVCRNIGRFFGNKFAKKNSAYIKIVSSAYRKFVMLIIVSTIPTGIIGVIFSKVFNMDNPSLIIPGISLLITGLMLSVVDELPAGHKTPKETTYKNSLTLGIAQGIATLPGISRSGTTLTVGVLCGLDRKFAIKYSFIMSIPAILGACVLDLKDLFTPGNAIGKTQLAYYGIGAVVAGVVGYVCIKTLLVLFNNKKMKYFSYYCFLIGIVAIVASFII
ncbi:MAG: undecaprenyl-diphosphate phosphatase [Lachnospiraceae bacterium]|nr:undecaprenyl-diphosphate phosphatase [Clostridiales bacterium]MDY2607966.1 undecaprenyl-diphosphate phosphatase [Lachnospiraceae bacterium]